MTLRNECNKNRTTAEVKRHLITHTNATFPQSLKNCQVQAKYGNTFNCQQDKIRDHYSTYKELKTRILRYFLHSSLLTMKVTIYQLICSRVLCLGKKVSQSYTNYTFRLSHQLKGLQGSVIG